MIGGGIFLLVELIDARLRDGRDDICQLDRVVHGKKTCLSQGVGLYSTTEKV